MTEEAKQRMIESVLKNARVGQLNIVMESGVTVNYYESSSEAHHVTVSDEQISRAINAINGKDKVLKHQQAFLGICCFLASLYKWPNNMGITANRLMQLPGADEWELPCRWDSFRRFLTYKFAMTDYAEWDDYNPSSSERDIFLECRDVARAFEQQLKLEMEK
jgi:hypothetical protein